MGRIKDFIPVKNAEYYAGQGNFVNWMVLNGVARGISKGAGIRPPLTGCGPADCRR